MFTMKLVEQMKHGKTLYPGCSLSVQKGEIVALYGQSEIRSMIMERIATPHTQQQDEITIDTICNRTNFKTFMAHTCCNFYDDGLYDRLTVLDHIHFYKQLYGSDQHVTATLDFLMLQDKKKTRVSQLTFSEQKRVHFSRMLFQDVSLYIFEEPDIHVDLDTKRIYLQLLQKLQMDDKYILILTSNLEHAITATSKVFQLDEQGCKQVQIEAEETDSPSNENVPFQFDKIPTKVEGKILLFDPFDIDYIESIDGQVFLHVKGQQFPTSFTLVHLEKRLSPFGFFRCHRSYIVNLQKVKEVITWTRNSFNLTLDDYGNTSIPLSKSKMSELKEMIGLP